MKIDLKEVTVCSVGSNDRLLAAHALEICNRQCKFADSILFSHEPVGGSFRNVAIEPLKSMKAYTHFMLKEIDKLIKSPFVLVTQWDGYVTNPESWRAEFLEYDYIGAVWPWHADEMRVGNGGFSLRSKKLLDIMAQPRFELLSNYGEDELICRAYRPLLEQKHGIRFAPQAVAERFAYERGVPLRPTFGFHGMINFYREVSDTELIKLVSLMPASGFKHLNCGQLAVLYYISQRWQPLRTLYRAWVGHFGVEEVRRQFVPSIPKEFLHDCIQACEALL